MKKLNLNEDNIRERVLTGEEFERLLGCLSAPLREMTLVAFCLCMRQREILDLTWDHFDFERNFIRLTGLAQIPRMGLSAAYQFTPRFVKCSAICPGDFTLTEFFFAEKGPVNNFSGNYKPQWGRAVQEVGLGGFTFHDLRHCAINNLRLTGNDHLTIMAISGHRTASVFRRYNVVTEEELQEVKWKTD